MLCCLEAWSTCIIAQTVVFGKSHSLCLCTELLCTHKHASRCLVVGATCNPKAMPDATCKMAYTPSCVLTAALRDDNSEGKNKAHAADTATRANIGLLQHVTRQSRAVRCHPAFYDSALLLY